MSTTSNTPAPTASMDTDEMDVDSSVKPSATNNPTTIDDDPVTATYNVFINPSLPLGRRLLVLQHPNRTDDSSRPPPTELRVKAQAGMVEVDVPLDNTVAYDREKGQKWGKTLHASMATKNGGSHGLAGGFGFGTVQARGGRKKAEDEQENMDWAEAVRQDRVLRTQTLGGQYPEYKEVQHMVGVFQGSKSHWLLSPYTYLLTHCQRTYISHLYHHLSIYAHNFTTLTQPSNKHDKTQLPRSRLPAQQPALLAQFT
ncbi:hypothetical protein LB503_003704 [Fusarium chuoi]|nr:hypothetical protein LB503_003704 [Fusarium chuoi]